MRFRRPIRRQAIRALKEANRLMDAGDYVAAAQIYEQLARGAKNRGLLKQAPFLFFQASKARILSEQHDRGFKLSFEGLKILKATQRWDMLASAGENSVEQLEKAGERDLVERMQKWLDSTLKDHKSSGDLDIYKTYAKRQKGSIPPNCSQCGANLNPKEIEWLDSNTVECLYCGSSIRTDL